MAADEDESVYLRRECIVFRKTKDAYGGLSNMAAGYPLTVNAVAIATAEALFQACKFPLRPDVQRLIIGQASPMAAKMVGRPHQRHARADWFEINVAVMRWCLGAKLTQHWEKFGALLRATGTSPIVEDSARDGFWGAKPLDEETLRGHNMLGRLLIELRASLLEGNVSELRTVAPLPISDFLLMGRQIESIMAPTSQGSAGAETQPGARQMQFEFFADEDE